MLKFWSSPSSAGLHWQSAANRVTLHNKLQRRTASAAREKTPQSKICYRFALAVHRLRSVSKQRRFRRTASATSATRPEKPPSA